MHIIMRDRVLAHRLKMEGDLTMVSFTILQYYIPEACFENSDAALNTVPRRDLQPVIVVLWRALHCVQDRRHHSGS